MKLVTIFCIAAAAATTPAVFAQDRSSQNCIGLLDGFTPYEMVDRPEFDDVRFDSMRNARALAEPIDIDGDGVKETIFLAEGFAHDRVAFNFMVLVSPDASFREDKFASDFAAELKSVGVTTGFVRARMFAHLNKSFRLTGPAAKNLPDLSYAFVQIGHLGDHAFIRLRVQPALPGYDPVTQKMTGDPDERYELFAKMKSLDELEILCSWKMTAVTTGSRN